MFQGFSDQVLERQGLVLVKLSILAAALTPPILDEAFEELATEEDLTDEEREFLTQPGSHF